MVITLRSSGSRLRGGRGSRGDAGFFLLGRAVFHQESCAVEDMLIGIDGAAQADGQGQGVGGAGVDLHRIMLADTYQLGVEDTLLQIAYDDLLQVDSKGAHEIFHKVVRERRLGAFFPMPRQLPGLQTPDNDRQASQAVHLSQHNSIGVGLRYAMRQSHYFQFDLLINNSGN